MQEAEEQRGRRSQRDDSLAHKLAVVGDVARGELSKKQAKPRYGIQGRSTGLVWGRKDAPPFAPCKPAGYISSGAPLAVERSNRTNCSYSTNISRFNSHKAAW